MTTLYLIRHGQSAGNLTHTFTGQLDLALTEQGIEQARLTAAYLADKPIVAVYASSLSRAIRTAEMVAEPHKAAVKAADALMEINAGLWQGNTYEKNAATYPAYQLWRQDIGRSKADGGESVADVSERVCPAVEAIAKAHDGESVAIVSHGVALRALLTHAYGLPVERMREVPWTTNASVTTLTYQNGSYTVVEFSHDAHLGDLASGFPKTV